MVTHQIERTDPEFPNSPMQEIQDYLFSRKIENGYRENGPSAAGPDSLIMEKGARQQQVCTQIA